MDSTALSSMLDLIVALVILAAAWTVLRAVLKFTMRIFSCGCAALVVVGGVLVLLSYAGILTLS